MSTPLNTTQLRIARQEATKVLAGSEVDPKGWLRYEMASVIIQLLDMVGLPEPTPPVVSCDGCVHAPSNCRQRVCWRCRRLPECDCASIAGDNRNAVDNFQPQPHRVAHDEESLPADDAHTEYCPEWSSTGALSLKARHRDHVDAPPADTLLTEVEVLQGQSESLEFGDGHQLAEQALELLDRLAAELLEARERLAEVRDKIQQAGNLLAVIHHDGGHHINAVGWKQACRDAIQDVIATRTELANARYLERQRILHILDQMESPFTDGHIWTNLINAPILRRHIKEET